MLTYDVLIVGAGHAGAQAAISLRQAKFTGTIGLLGEERDIPYERPALSKEYLSGEKPFERLFIRPASFWKERGVDLLLGRRVVELDAARRAVRLSDSAWIRYDKLIWAAGGVPRRLTCEGASLTGIHSVRTRPDVDRLIAELPTTSRVVIVGGGYIGLEAASVLTKLRKHVTLVEASSRVLARVAGEQVSRFFQTEHRAHGVDLRLSSSVQAFEGSQGRVTGVRLTGGELLPCQMAIVGIGISPAVEPLIAAGAIGGDGVEVDEGCRTSLPHVFAVGDCASHVNRYGSGNRIRVESVQNANDQAVVAAKIIAGDDVIYDALPWFWSNQYDIRLQTVGIAAGHDATVIRGNPQSRSFSVAYLKAGRLISFDCINATKDYAQARKLVSAGVSPDLSTLADPAISLRDLV